MKNAIKSSLFSVVLLSSAATAIAAGGPPHALYNPNPEPLSVTNTISEVSGYVGGFIDSEANVNGDLYNPDNVSIIYPLAGEVYATVTDSYTGETMGSMTQAGNAPQRHSLAPAFSV